LKRKEASRRRREAREDALAATDRLENQIYKIFRKSRVVTNVSANSLFALPTHGERFVFVDSEWRPSRRPVEEKIRVSHARQLGRLGEASGVRLLGDLVQSCDAGPQGAASSSGGRRLLTQSSSRKNELPPGLFSYLNKRDLTDDEDEDCGGEKTRWPFDSDEMAISPCLGFVTSVIEDEFVQ
jgi:hypothetical protein